jgi:predicted GNAT superfamily acetyltransferase
VPAVIHELKKSDQAAAEEMQGQVRQQFEQWFGQGYAVIGFDLNQEAGTYLLEPFEG